MKKENSAVFNAKHLIRGEYDIVKPCALLLTNDRIIVASLEGISLWTVTSVIVALAASFVGLILANVVLFLGGLGVAIVAGLCVVLLDYMIRHRRLSKIRQHNIERILENGGRNFQVPYSKITKVEVRPSESYTKVVFVPSYLREQQYVIDFIENKEKHTFIIDDSSLQPCLNLLSRFLPETVEIEQTE